MSRRRHHHLIRHSPAEIVDEMVQAIQAAASVGLDDAAGWVVLPSHAHGIDRLFRVNKIQHGDLLSLDLLEIDHSDNPLFADRETFEIDGHTIQLLSRSSLIQMKQSSGRLKDQLDVELLKDRSDER